MRFKYEDFVKSRKSYPPSGCSLTVSQLMRLRGFLLIYIYDIVYIYDMRFTLDSLPCSKKVSYPPSGRFLTVSQLMRSF